MEGIIVVCDSAAALFVSAHSLDDESAFGLGQSGERWEFHLGGHGHAVQEADVADIAQEFGLVPKMTLAGLPGITATKKILAVDGNNSWKIKATGASKEIFFLLKRRHRQKNTREKLCVAVVFINGRL